MIPLGPSQKCYPVSKKPVRPNGRDLTGSVFIPCGRETFPVPACRYFYEFMRRVVI